jgi:hypothetical protein
MAKDPGKVCYYDNILQTIGKTPLVKLNRVTNGAKGLILAKVETFNPGGSVKDRIGVSIVEEAEQDGRLKPGGTIVESTSGNTGMGLALVAAVTSHRKATRKSQRKLSAKHPTPFLPISITIPATPKRITKARARKSGNKPAGRSTILSAASARGARLREPENS